ncbi:MAG: nucleotidyltransferase domain-containing protein [Anaerolineales bacterium]|jgi:predicted nucleotidyltransferase
MVEPTILRTVQQYLDMVRRADIHVSRAILFGSHVRGDSHPDSDIDILVIAPEFDEPFDKRRVDLLWELRARSDSRIEPIPVGERQWQEDDASAIIEIARRKGKEIPLPIAT